MVLHILAVILVCEASCPYPSIALVSSILDSNPCYLQLFLLHKRAEPFPLFYLKEQYNHWFNQDVDWIPVPVDNNHYHFPL